MGTDQKQHIPRALPGATVCFALTALGSVRRVKRMHSLYLGLHPRLFCAAPTALGSRPSHTSHYSYRSHRSHRSHFSASLRLCEKSHMLSALPLCQSWRLRVNQFPNTIDELNNRLIHKFSSAPPASSCPCRLPLLPARRSAAPGLCTSRR